MHDDSTEASGITHDEHETKRKEPVRRRGSDDSEHSIEIPELRIRVDEGGRGEHEDGELAQLRSELAAAKGRHAKAEQDVQSPGWGRWVKYVFFTATENANSVETVDFTVARIAVFGGLGAVGYAVSYLLPAFDMSQVQSMDRATNTTSPQQTLADHANVAYYWGNATSYGYTAIATFIGGLAGIRRSYKAMRERILAQAALERDQAQANLDTYVKCTARLREMQGRCDAAENSREVAVASERQARERAEKALARVVKLERELGSVNTRSAKLDGALKLSERATDEAQDEARKLKTDINRLTREVNEAKADSTLSREQAEKQRAEADALDLRLGEARREIERQALRIGTLELENNTSKHVISMLETAITKIDQADQKIETVSAKVNQLSEQAQTKVSVGSKEIKD